MKKNVFVLLVLLSTISVFAQNKVPMSLRFNVTDDVDHVVLYPPSAKLIEQDLLEEQKNGTAMKVGELVPANLSVKNSGSWATLPNGAQIWRLRISCEGAKASGLYFDSFDIPSGATVYVYTPDYKIIDGPYTGRDNESGQEYMIGNLLGDDIVIEYDAPMHKTNAGKISSDIEIPNIKIGEYGYVFREERMFSRGRGFGDSEDCEINVNCSEGTNWQIQKKGVARILLVQGSGTYYCTGTLINNTSNDGTPYFLTANHCGPSATTSNFNQWKFRFNYESTGCNNPSYESSINYKDVVGCTKIATGSMDGGSDFYLLKLSKDKEYFASIGAIYNGWDRGTTGATSGVGIHHPYGDIKKISTYTRTLTTATYSGTDMTCASSAHWKVYWAETTHGRGVTEGGSSGSPLFNSNGLVVGTLSGGSAVCNNTYTYDLYGKMSYHWSSNGTTNSKQLKPWLDPNNTGATTCPIYDPSNQGGGGDDGGDDVPVSSFSYNFESCTAFAVDDFSPCTTYDGDASATYGISGYEFPNSGYVGSFIAFENTPSSSNLVAHGGTKCGVCFAATTPPNDDWFITPSIIITSGMQFSFWAKSATDTYGLEQFKVLVSTDHQNYTSISGSSTVSAPTTWKKFTYDLSAYVGRTIYLAIRCVSNDVFAFMIDDLVVGVPSAVESQIQDEIKVYPNPAKGFVNVELPESATISIVNMLGQVVKTVDCDSDSTTISVEGLERGVYFLNIEMQDKKIVRKVVVE